MSSLINKVKDAVAGDKSEDTTTIGTNDSNLVDRTIGCTVRQGAVDTIGRTRMTETIGTGLGNVEHAGTGPHSSHTTRELDPCVDPATDSTGVVGDATTSSTLGSQGLTDRRGNNTSGSAGLGNNTTQSGKYENTSNISNITPPSMTEAETHSSRLANKINPRVDSDQGQYTGLSGRQPNPAPGTNWLSNTDTAGKSGGYGHESGDTRGSAIPRSAVASATDAQTARALQAAYEISHRNTDGTSNPNVGTDAVQSSSRLANEKDARGQQHKPIGGVEKTLASHDHFIAASTAEPVTTHGNHHHGHHGHHHGTAGLVGSANTGSTARHDHHTGAAHGLENTTAGHENHKTGKIGGLGTASGTHRHGYHHDSGSTQTTHGTADAVGVDDGIATAHHETTSDTTASKLAAQSSDGSGIMGSGTHSVGASAIAGSGRAPDAAGPHQLDLLNKHDPRVNSNLGGSETTSNNTTS